jgi:hypothetical protein
MSPKAHNDTMHRLENQQHYGKVHHKRQTNTAKRPDMLRRLENGWA